MARLGVCAYVWAPEGDDPPAWGGVPLSPWAEDPMITAPLAPFNEFMSAHVAVSEVHFLHHVHGLTPGGARFELGPWSGAPRVTIGVPDTSPRNSYQGEIPVGRDLHHGYNVARIAERISCPLGPPCPARIMTDQALHLPSSPEGEYRGTIAELAASVRAIVDRWEHPELERREGGPSSILLKGRLVINLSIGWDPASDKGCEPSPTATDDVNIGALLVTQLLHQQLEYAVCKGALVIAAAGNDLGYGPKQHGLMCPARWESQLPPSEARCAELGVPGAEPAGAFIYAVGAIDYDRRPLYTTRFFGLPGLVALGHRGVALGDPSVSRPLTGSSVSAAAAAGVAASVWAARPTLSAEQVMKIVASSGVPLSAKELPTWAAQPGIAPRRISLCRAMVAACSAGPCPFAIPSGCVDPELPSEEGPEAPPFALTDQEETLYEEVWTNLDPPNAMPMAPLGDPLLPSATNADIHPQPTDPPCPTCAFSFIDHELSVYIDPSYPSTLGGLSALSLRFFGVLGEPLGALHADGNRSWLYPGAARRIQVFAHPPAARSVLLTWMRADGSLVSQDVLLR